VGAGRVKKTRQTKNLEPRFDSIEAEMAPGRGDARAMVDLLALSGIGSGAAGAGSGLAFRTAESGYRLNIPRMFAALLLLSAAGIVIYGLLALISHRGLRCWHESAL
jgi:hypothetical protein